MAKYDAEKTMKDSLNNSANHLPCWQCESCGRKYSSLEELQATPCTAYSSVVKCDCGQKAKDAYALFGGIWDAYHFVTRNSKCSESGVNASEEASRIVNKYMPCDNIGYIFVRKLTEDVLNGKVTKSASLGKQRAAECLEAALWFAARNAEKDDNYTRKNELPIFMRKYKDKSFWTFLYVISHFGAYLDYEKQDMVFFDDRITLSGLNNYLVVPVLNEANSEHQGSQTILKFALDNAIMRIQRGQTDYNQSTWTSIITTIRNNVISDYEYWNAVYAMIGLKFPWKDYFEFNDY